MPGDGKRDRERPYLEHFLLCLKEKPCIWDRSHNDYKCQFLKNSAWDDLFRNMCDTFGLESLNIMGLRMDSVKNMKAKWQNIQATYNRLKREIMARQPADTNELEILSNSTTWPYFNLCKALDHENDMLAMPDGGESNSMHAADDYDSADYQNMCSVEIKEEMSPELAQSADAAAPAAAVPTPSVPVPNLLPHHPLPLPRSMANHAPDPPYMTPEEQPIAAAARLSAGSLSSNSNSNFPAGAKRRRRNSSGSSHYGAGSNHREARNDGTSMVKICQVSQDEDDAFGCFVATQLRQLTREKKMVVRKQLMDLLTKAGMPESEEK